MRADESRFATSCQIGVQFARAGGGVEVWKVEAI
jgi:hypothetical protein